MVLLVSLLRFYVCVNIARFNRVDRKVLKTRVFVPSLERVFGASYFSQKSRQNSHEFYKTSEGNQSRVSASFGTSLDVVAPKLPEAWTLAHLPEALVAFSPGQ
jgi:hypothetical protein